MYTLLSVTSHNSISRHIRQAKHLPRPRPAKPKKLAGLIGVCLYCVSEHKRINMATIKRKRVQVQLPIEVFEIVEEISNLGGVAMGILLAELITENKSGLLLIRDALIAARNNDVSGAIDRLQESLLDSMGKSVDLSKDMNEAKRVIRRSL